MYSKFFVFAVYALLQVSIVPDAFAQIDPIDKDGLAIGGYDLVAYFKLNKAVKGDAAIKSIYQNATYLFANDDNKKVFDLNPERYLPQYEGYCALAVGTTAKKISIDPETFKVTDNKLYLFYNGRAFSGAKFNSLEPWIKDEANLIRKSNENWPTVKKKKYHYQK